MCELNMHGRLHVQSCTLTLPIISCLYKAVAGRYTGTTRPVPRVVHVSSLEPPLKLTIFIAYLLVQWAPIVPPALER